MPRKKTEEIKEKTKKTKQTKSKKKDIKTENTESNVKKPRKPKVDKVVKEEAVKEEVNKEIVEEKVVEIKNDNLLLEKKTDYNKLTYILGIMVLVISLFAIGFTIASNTSKHTYNLQMICEDCFTEDDKLVLPHKYYLDEYGTIYSIEDDILVANGAFYAYAMEEEEYNSEIDMIKESYGELEEEIIKDNTYTKLPLGDYTYYFSYQNNSMIQFIISNTDEDLMSTLINGLKIK